MKLQDQVCTEHQAKQLVALGIECETLFYHVFPKDKKKISTHRGVHAMFYAKDIIAENEGDEFDHEMAPAYTVAELGLILKDRGLPIYWELWKEWAFKVGDQPQGYGTEAVARAALLIHLLEKGSITAAEVNQRLQNT
jgi:hypothetical protein